MQGHVAALGLAENRFCDFSLAHATWVHSIDCVVVGEQCKQQSADTARVVDVLGSTFRSSS